MRSKGVHSRARALGWPKTFALVAIGALVLAACGDDDGTDDGSGVGAEDEAAEGDAAEGDAGEDEAAEDEDGATTGEQIVLDFPSWQANEPGNAAVYEAIIEEFESRHGNVTIDFYHVSNDDFQNQMVTRLAAGDPPDIIPSGNHFHAFAGTGQLEPLNDRLEASGLLDEWQDFQQERVIGGDHLALALHAHTRILYFNQEFLDEAGVSEPPSTPDELQTAVEAVEAAGIEGVSPWGATTTSHSNLFGELTPFIVGMGSQWIVDGEWAVTDPTTVEAVELYRSLVSDAPPGLDGGGYRQLLADGRVAMAHDGNWVLAFLDDTADEGMRDNIQIAETPFENAVAALGTSLSMPSSISDERKDLVWEFIEIAAEPEFQAMWAENIDAAPGRIGTVPDELIDERPEIAVIEANIGRALPEFPDSENFSANFGEIEQRIIDQVMRMLTGDEPTEQILQDLEEQLAGITEP